MPSAAVAACQGESSEGNKTAEALSAVDGFRIAPHLRAKLEKNRDLIVILPGPCNGGEKTTDAPNDEAHGDDAYCRYGQDGICGHGYNLGWNPVTFNFSLATEIWVLTEETPMLVMRIIIHITY